LFAFSVICIAEAEEKVVLKNKNATIHDIVASSQADDVEVAEPYKKSIKLYKLEKNDVAYWVPDGGKYIIAGEYADIWCSVHKKDNTKSLFHWIVIEKDALYKALEVGHQYSSGVAFYKLTFDGKDILFQTYLYSTLHAMAQGEKVIEMKE